MPDPDHIADDEVILRHIPGGTLHQAPGPRITSKNFELRTHLGETGLSVSRAGMTSPDLLLARVGNVAKGSRVAVVTAAEIRAIGLEVVPDPLPDDPGHSEIRSAGADLNDQAVRKLLSITFHFLPPSDPRPPADGS